MWADQRSLLGNTSYIALQPGCCLDIAQERGQYLDIAQENGFQLSFDTHFDLNATIETSNSLFSKACNFYLWYWVFII